MGRSVTLFRQRSFPDPRHFRGALALTAEASTYPSPDAFGPFRVLHQIGAGRLGPVFRAWQADRDRLVAIKVFQLDLVPEQVTALVAELQKLVAQRLAHGAIAAPIGAGIQGGAAYLAQEFCTGESLDVAMRQGSGWPAARALKVLGRIGSAIDIAAARGANHGALHPRDVLLSAADVRVTGFGVLQALERAGLRVLGRHPYGAPELAEGQRSGTPADVYALAVLAYELLAGKRVSGISDQSVEQLAAAQQADRTALRQVFATALAMDPGARYRTARAFTTALEGALGGASPRLPGLDTGADDDAEQHPDDEDQVQEMTPDLTLRSIVTFPGVVPAGPTTAPGDVDGLDLPLAADDVPAERARERSGAFDTSVLDEEPPAAEPTVDLPEPASAPIPSQPAPPQRAAAERPVQRPPLFAEVSSDDEPEETVAPVPQGIAYTATWPLVLALGVGLLVGFALGYGFGMRDVSVTLATRGIAPAASPANRGAATGVAQPPASAAAATAASGISERDLSEQPGSAPGQVAPAAERAATPARPVDGRLVIRSTPAGARVLLNGRVRGVTPLSLSGLPFATYRLRLELSGYLADERRVGLDASSATQILAETLRPVSRPPTGSVVVESRPSGAQVFIDEHLVGRTPLTLPAVSAGQHHLRLAQPGFRAWIATVDVTGGDSNRVTASLEQGPPHE